MSKLCIRRPVTTTMVLLIVLLAGFISLTGLKLDLMPSMDIPVAIVSTTYIGAGPEEIETLITKPLEESLGTVSNVDTISSTSSANSSIIIVQFEDGTDVDMAAIDMREKVDMIKGLLPDDANDPMVLKLDVTAMTSIVVGATSDTLSLAQLNTLLDENIVNRFERIEGVASVTLSGGVENEVEIVVIPERMQGYGITENQISQVLSSENLNYPTGQLTQGETKLQVRSVGEFKSIDEIRNLPITSSSGAMLHLSDIAQINEVEKDMDSYSLIDGEPSIMLIIQKQSTANTVEVSDRVNAEIEKVLNDYEQVNIKTLSDTSDYIKTSINNIITTAFQAAIVAVAIIFIFLRDVRTSVIIGISIPTSIVATFALMYICGMTMNMISMSGIAMGIGMLVDNSVVVLDNMDKYWKDGMNGRKAAERGSSEVGMAITASTLTTVAVFFPLMFSSGITGQLFKDLSLTITFSLVCSLFVSLTFVPMAYSRLLSYHENKQIKKKKSILVKILDLWGKGMDKIDNGYGKVLAFALRNKKKVLLLFLILFIASLGLVPIIGIDFMPSMDQGVANISIEMPKGTVIEETEKVLNEVLERIDGIPETDMIYASIGGGGISLSGSSTDNASVTMNLVGIEERDRSTDEVVTEIRTKLRGIVGADITVSASSSAMGSFGGSAVSIQLSGDENDVLKELGDKIVNLISGIDGITDATSSSEDSVPEANIVLNRAKASVYGITSAQVANAVSTAVTGTVATQYKVNGTEIDVRIRQDKNSMQYINDLEDIKITAPTGAIIPLTEVADIVMKDSALSITRENQHRYITVSADVNGRAINEIQADLTVALDNFDFPDGYDYSFTGTMESMAESYSSLMLALIVAILLVFMIMASQFESLIHPFVVMFSVPLAMTGAILGLFITGKTITITAFMGFITLAGTVVNNAIVLVDYTNQLIEKHGMECDEALIKAGPNRLRPILMTTLTTVLGMVPMALGVGEGMEMQQPLAIAVIFGLSLSTVVTLVFVPIIYSIVNNMRFKHIKKKRKLKKVHRKETREEIVNQSL